jgi:alpha-1,2-glucosyltransferase
MAQSPGARVAARRFITASLICFGIAAVAYGGLHVTLSRAAVVHVTWAAGVDDALRLEAEQRYSLSLGERLEERTWGYTLTDLSRANIRRLVSEAVVENTQDIDRTAFRVGRSAPRRADPGAPPWIRVTLWAVTMLGLLGGLTSLTIGRVVRAGPDMATGQFAPQAITKQRLTMNQWLSLLFVMTVMGACFLAVRSMDLRVDEQENQAQIERYVAGNYRTITGTTGGFHAVAAVVATLTGQSRKEDIRLLVLLISGATMLVFWWLLTSVDPQVATVRTLQFVFFPLLFPFWFLIYSDVFALMLLLLAVLALTLRRFHVTGLLMIVSLVVRQTYIVWMALLGLWTVIVNVAEPLRSLVTRGASFGIGAGLFLLFVIVNGGVAVGDRDNHPDMEIHSENVIFMLVCFVLMFLPLIVSKLPQITRLPRAVLVAVPLASVALFFGTFRVDHSGNTQWQDYYIRNAMLETMTSSLVAGVVVSVAMALAVLSLCVIRLRQPAHYLIYPFAALSVMPVGLIEQRYYIPVFALFMLFRESSSPGVERTLVALYIVMALYLFAGIVGGQSFL